jgi:hypothetical protein
MTNPILIAENSNGVFLKLGPTDCGFSLSNLLVHVKFLWEIESSTLKDTSSISDS